MIGIFKQKTPGNIIILLILGFAIKLPALLRAPLWVTRDSDGPFYQAFLRFMEPLAKGMPWIYSFITFGLLFLNAYLITYFMNTNRLVSRSNFLAGMAYLLLSTLIIDFNTLSAALVASSFFLVIFIVLFKIYAQKQPNTIIFNAGFLLGIAALIYTPAMLFSIMLFLSVAILRAFKLNEWFLIVLGIAAPFYFYGIGLYLMDEWPRFLTIYRDLDFGISKHEYSMWVAGALFLTILPLFTGLYYVQATSARMLIHVRKAWYLILLAVVVCAFISLFYFGKGFEGWVLMLPFIAALHGYGYFSAELKIYPKLCFWLTIVFIIAQYVYN